MRRGWIALGVWLCFVGSARADDLTNCRPAAGGYGYGFSCTIREQPTRYQRGAGVAAALSGLAEGMELQRLQQVSQPQVVYVAVPASPPVPVMPPPAQPKTYQELCPDFPLFCEEWKKQGLVAQAPPAVTKKFCPMGGEIYDNSIRFCPTHGVEVKPYP